VRCPFVLADKSGFSYVYLVTDSGGSLYALKKIRCPFGEESVRNAMREVEAYNLFNHKSIIKCIVRLHSRYLSVSDFRTMQQFKNAMERKRSISSSRTFEEGIYKTLSTQIWSIIHHFRKSIYSNYFEGYVLRWNNSMNTNSRLYQQDDPPWKQSR
jgi:hypothetical protein